MTKMQELAKVKNINTPAVVKAKTAARKIHGAAAAEKAASRAKDPSALQKAVLRKLEAQRDFALAYNSSGFHAGRDNSLSTERITAKEFCQSFGFAYPTVMRWVERLLEAANFQIEKQRRLAKVWQICEMITAASYSSESVEWYTPTKYIEAIREVLGEIDFDPASSEFANRTVKAKTFMTGNDNPLNVEWHGRFFMNPPYGVDGGESVAGLFCRKAIDEHIVGHVTGVILVNSLHSQKWQRCLYDFPVCFVDHRIHFVSGDGEENENPTFQNIFVYLGNNIFKFAEVFRKFGYVMVPYES